MRINSVNPPPLNIKCQDIQTKIMFLITFIFCSSLSCVFCFISVYIKFYQYKTFKRYFTQFSSELSVEREWQREEECRTNTHYTLIHTENRAQTTVAHLVRVFAVHVNKCKGLLYSFLVYSKCRDEKYRGFHTGAIRWYNTIKMYMVHLWIHRLIAFSRSKWSFQTCRVVARAEKWREK